MKRLIMILSFVVYLAISHSALGEPNHAGGAGTQRQVIEVPAIGAGERLGELVNACSVGRPFPALRTTTVEIGGGGSEAAPVVGDSAPSVGTGGGVGNLGSTLSGSAVFGKCTTCHSSPTAFKTGLSGVRTQTSSGLMPQGGTPLSADEQSALLTYLESQGLK